MATDLLELSAAVKTGLLFGTVKVVHRVTHECMDCLFVISVLRMT